ncbi:DUF1569 domain-containing protein [Pedobacter paludis]|uniref:DUF1569 domain-containing protein n=1 Tax=Pedobacter paludis TaxID=2203212 RepID=A0A317EZS4_9SPHI|nr:DUF1569 domain-containing protein [Pedobacter paludis]PWS32015.1 hypothetical protein DF947_09525 [Pedobacter paludis]
MKTIFNDNTRQEVISRIQKLDENSEALWGKMNICQMLKHCIRAEEMYLGNVQYNRTILGYLIGRIALKGIMKDDKPLHKNAPTSSHFKIAETTGHVQEDKLKWVALIEDYAKYPNQGLMHWFFGKMTNEQVGHFVYKHADHHLRQFNC